MSIAHESSATETELTTAAFGTDPGRWPLPAPTTARALWMHAVAAGGQGRYGTALADLAALVRLPDAVAEVSLAHSTRASLLRQLGWHVRARGWDGQALAVATTPDARADALIGLAADALGVGRFAVSARLLQLARDVVADGVADRLPVRLAWVTAELAMARGDGRSAGGKTGAVAVEAAERAVRLAATLGSVRHTVKSDIILAAACCSAGDLRRSRGLADAALADAGRLGLIPLRWAAACLLADIGSATLSPARVGHIRDDCADTVRRRGGRWAGP